MTLKGCAAYSERSKGGRESGLILVVLHRSVDVLASGTSPGGLSLGQGQGQDRLLKGLYNSKSNLLLRQRNDLEGSATAIVPSLDVDCP